MYPVIVLTLTAILGLYLGLYPKTKPLALPINLLGILTSIVISVYSWDHPSPLYFSMIHSDHYSIAYSIAILVATGLIMAISKKSLGQISTHITEYFSILMFSASGGLIMVSFQNLTMLFVGLEILSVSVYILAGIEKKNKEGNEAALKYFLMGSFFTAILLLGIAFLYGATGTFNIHEMAGIIHHGKAISAFLYLGVILVLIALCFKVSVAPFHFWTPDVYEGSPILVTAFMSTVVKIAGFGAFLRLFSISFPSITQELSGTLSILVILTLFIGNINALYQNSMKRMLAYSGISHAGFMLMAILALGTLSSNAILIYAIGYSLATITAFGILMVVNEEKGSSDFTAFYGFGKKNPVLAGMMAISMLSLAGIPLTAGFFGKFYIFSNTMDHRYIFLVGIGVINAIMGIFYYFRVIIAMFFVDSEHHFEELNISFSLRFAFVLTTVVTIVLGFYPSLFANILN